MRLWPEDDWIQNNTGNWTTERKIDTCTCLGNSNDFERYFINWIITEFHNQLNPLNKTLFLLILHENNIISIANATNLSIENGVLTKNYDLQTLNNSDLENTIKN